MQTMFFALGLLVDSGRAWPCLILSSSAVVKGVRRPTPMSLVMCSPPVGNTTVCQMLPSMKMAMSVVPLDRESPMPLWAQLETELRRRLNDGGLLVQFVPLPFFEEDELRGVGRAHLEGFGSIENVARAKGEIAQGLGADG